MKLRMITEVIVADQDMIFNYLGSAANKVFGGKNKKLPDRYRRYEQKQVEYQKALNPQYCCGTCKFFEEKQEACMLVDGKINPQAVCRLWTDPNDESEEEQDDQQGQQSQAPTGPQAQNTGTP